MASRFRISSIAAISFVLGLFLTIPTFAADPLDYAIPGGWFYTQTNGQDGAKTGFGVVDDVRAPFYREFKRLGGVPTVGYPISDRFVWDGFETQAFQKLIFQWRPEKNTVDFVNVFDKLSESGKDDWLLDKKGVPRQGKFDESSKDFGTIQRDRLALLDGYPALKQFYFTVPGDPVAFNGLPTSEIKDINNAYVLRAQRVVLQQWKVNVPWARAGDVTLANGGDVSKEAGLLPADAIRPRDPNSASAGNPAPSATPSVARTPIPPAGLPNVVGPLSVSLRVEGALPSGGAGRLIVRVVGADSAGVVGSVVTILVHFPLGPNETAYATDVVVFVPTGPDGVGIANVRIPAAVPSGTGITIEATAIYPPHSGHTEIRAVVS